MDVADIENRVLILLRLTGEDCRACDLAAATGITTCEMMGVLADMKKRGAVCAVAVTPSVERWRLPIPCSDSPSEPQA